MAAIAPLEVNTQPIPTPVSTTTAALEVSAARLRSLQASRTSLRSRRRQSNATSGGQSSKRPQSANRVLLQSKRDEERHFRCQFYSAIGLAVMGGFLCVAGISMISYGLPTPDRLRRDYGDLTTDQRLQIEVRLMLYGRLGGILLGGGVFFILVLLVIGLDYKMYLDRQRPVENAAAEMNRRLYANIMQNLRRAAEDADTASLSTSHRSSDRRSSVAVTLMANGGSTAALSTAALRPSRPSTASGRRSSLVNLIPGISRRNSLPVKDLQQHQQQQRLQLSPTWKVNGAFDFSDEAVEQIKSSDGDGVASLEELFNRQAVTSPKFQMEDIVEEAPAASTAAAATTLITATSSATGSAKPATAASTPTADVRTPVTSANATTIVVVTTATPDVPPTRVQSAGTPDRQLSTAAVPRTSPVGPATMPPPAELTDGAPESRVIAAKRSPPSQQPQQQQSRRPQTVVPRRASLAKPAAVGISASATARQKTAGAPVTQQKRQQQQQVRQTTPGTANPQTRGTPATTEATVSDSRPGTAAANIREYTMVFDSDSESTSSASDEEFLYQQSGGANSVTASRGGGDHAEQAPNPTDSQNNLNQPGAEKPLKEKLWREDTTDENASQDQSIIEEMTREIVRNLEIEHFGATASGGSTDPGFSVQVHVHVHVSRNSSPNRQQQPESSSAEASSLPPPSSQTQPRSQTQPLTAPRSKPKMLDFEHDGAI